LKGNGFFVYLIWYPDGAVAEKQTYLPPDSDLMFKKKLLLIVPKTPAAVQLQITPWT